MNRKKKENENRKGITEQKERKMGLRFKIRKKDGPAQLAVHVYIVYRGRRVSNKTIMPFLMKRYGLI